MLISQKTGNIDNESKDKLERISVSAERMQSLINDLSNLTSLTAIDEAKKVADTGRILQYLLLDNDEKIRNKEALIEVKQLPVITGFENQLKILLNALLDNALKFSKPGVKPVIRISSDIVTGKELSEINPNLKHKKFNRITIADNGIGFDKQFVGKMFQIFQRLHQPEAGYEGKGIGLAICQRIMANHEGYILAEGVPMEGATFKLFFPVDE